MSVAFVMEKAFRMVIVIVMEMLKIVKDSVAVTRHLMTAAFAMEIIQAVLDVLMKMPLILIQKR